MNEQLAVALLAADACVALRKMGWTVERENRTDLIVQSKKHPRLNPLELDNDLVFLQQTDVIHNYNLTFATLQRCALVRVS